MDTVEKAMYYVDIVRSPYLGVYPDSGNLTNASLVYGKSVLDDMETGRGHIIALHLKESVPGKYREIPFGRGTSILLLSRRKRGRSGCAAMSASSGTQEMQTGRAIFPLQIRFCAVLSMRRQSKEGKQYAECK